MREIKFRAWDRNAKKMFPVQTIEQSFDDWQNTYLPTMLEATMANGEPVMFDPDKPFLMQYTGLKDKNGKEIYEGDIVTYSYIKNHPRVCKIVYEPKAAAFLLNDVSKGSINYVQMKYLGDIARDKTDTRTYELCEVIGNIMENPELMK